MSYTLSETFLFHLCIPEKIAQIFSGMTAGGEWGLYCSEAECGLIEFIQSKGRDTLLINQMGLYTDEI